MEGNNNAVEEEEEEDVDFYPAVPEDSSSEASSSVTSEKEDGCTVSSVMADLGLHAENDLPIPVEMMLQDSVCTLNEDNTMQLAETRDTVALLSCTREDASINLRQDELQEWAPLSANVKDSQNVVMEPCEEDAICKRTRARYSLANYTLEELEAFLQETDDEGDLHNVDEEEEYKKFLAAVLLGGDGVQAPQVDENIDEDENDADFEIEIEEALESDGDDNNDAVETIDRPHTRQRINSNGNTRVLKNGSSHSKVYLRPVLPSVPSASPGFQYYLHQGHPVLPPTVAGANFSNPFTSEQIGQLYVLVHEHVQLLIQIYSLCALDLAKQQVATKAMTMMLEMVSECEEALSRRRFPHPSSCFQDVYRFSSVGVAPNQNLQYQWRPLIDSPVISVLDVAPIRLARSYVNDVTTIARKLKQSHLDGSLHEDFSPREPLFLIPRAGNISGAKDMHVEGDSVSSTPGKLPDQKQLKRALSANVLECPEKSVALVPHDIAKSVKKFFPLFNVALFPHKPPVTAVANRILFTDAEDRLLAMGLMECNTDWSAIQRRFLPCKTKHQIFIRQKNCSASKAPENPIKSVRRMKYSPLTEDELLKIKQGLKVFKNDWMSVWKYCVPHRDPSLLPRLWRTATGVQKSYSHSESSREKRRLYEAKRRKLKNSSCDTDVQSMAQDVGDDSPCDGDEDNNEEAYVHEAFLSDTRKLTDKSYNSLQMNSPSKSTMRPVDVSYQMNAHTVVSCGVTVHEMEGRAIRDSGNTISYNNIRNPALRADVQHLSNSLTSPASRKCKSNQSRVVKLAPGLPPVNLPPSVRVISQSALQVHENMSAYSNKKDSILQVPIAVFHRSLAGKALTGDSQGQASEVLERRTGGCLHHMEENSSDSFQMHPLLFRSLQEKHPMCGHVDESINVTENYDPPLCREAAANGSAGTSSIPLLKETPLNSNIIDIHPLLRRLDCASGDSVMLSSLSQPNGSGMLSSTVNLSLDLNRDGENNESVADHLHTQTEKLPARSFRSGTCADFDINLTPAPEHERDLFETINYAPEGGGVVVHNIVQARSLLENSKNNGISAVIKSSTLSGRCCMDEARGVATANESSFPCQQTAGFSEDSMQGIVMEHEELSDSEDDNDHVEFECEEMEDSEEEVDALKVAKKNTKPIRTKPRMKSAKPMRPCSSNQNISIVGDVPTKARTRRKKKQQVGTGQQDGEEQRQPASRRHRKNATFS